MALLRHSWGAEVRHMDNNEQFAKGNCHDRTRSTKRRRRRCNNKNNDCFFYTRTPDGSAINMLMLTLLLFLLSSAPLLAQAQTTVIPSVPDAILQQTPPQLQTNLTCDPLTVDYTGDGAADVPGFSTGNDCARITGESNILDAQAGNDEIQVLGDANLVRGQEGTDVVLLQGNTNVVEGTRGADTLHAIGDGNTLIGDVGPDVILVQGNDNTLQGDDGQNTLTLLPGSQGNTVTAGEQSDEITLYDNANDNEINSGNSADVVTLFQSSGNTINGQSGDDQIYVLGGANNTVNGQSDADTVILVNSNSNQVAGGGGPDTLRTDGGVGNTLLGQRGQDVLIFSGAGHVLFGHNQQDVFVPAYTDFDYNDPVFQSDITAIMDYNVNDDDANGLEIIDFGSFTCAPNVAPGWLRVVQRGPRALVQVTSTANSCDEVTLFTLENFVATSSNDYRIANVPSGCLTLLEFGSVIQPPCNPDATPNPTSASPTTAAPTTTSPTTAFPTTVAPTLPPTNGPTPLPTVSPTALPTLSPTLSPTMSPTLSPTLSPTAHPTPLPTLAPITNMPSFQPVVGGTPRPTAFPTTATPTLHPTTATPTLHPISEAPATMGPTTSPATASPQVGTIPTTMAPSASPVAVVETNPTNPPPTSLAPTSSPMVQTINESSSSPTGAPTTPSPSPEVEGTVVLPSLSFEFELEPGTILDEVGFDAFLQNFVQETLLEANGPAALELDIDIAYNHETGVGMAVVTGTWTGPLANAPSESTFLREFGFWGVEEFTLRMRDFGYAPTTAIDVQVNGKLVQTVGGSSSQGDNGDSSSSKDHKTIIIAAIALCLMGTVIVLALTFLWEARRRRRKRDLAQQRANKKAMGDNNGDAGDADDDGTDEPRITRIPHTIMNASPPQVEFTPPRRLGDSAPVAISPMTALSLAGGTYASATGFGDGHEGETGSVEESLFTAGGDSTLMPPPDIVTPQYDPSRLDNLISRSIEDLEKQEAHGHCDAVDPPAPAATASSVVAPSADGSFPELVGEPGYQAVSPPGKQVKIRSDAIANKVNKKHTAHRRQGTGGVVSSWVSAKTKALMGSAKKEKRATTQDGVGVDRNID